MWPDSQVGNHWYHAISNKLNYFGETYSLPLFFYADRDMENMNIVWPINIQRPDSFFYEFVFIWQLNGIIVNNDVNLRGSSVYMLLSS